jgi:trans-aconitate 2-methyltransferase
MTTSDWDATLYLNFGNERLRPALDLLAQIPSEDPKLIYDLGCGPGNATVHLKQRWPNARIVGIDSSADMIQKAKAVNGDIEWQLADLNTWRPDAQADLLYTNATLHWLDDHETLLPALLDAVKPGGVMAIQIPNNFSAPSHTSIADVVREGPWQERLKPFQREHPVKEMGEYYQILRPHVTSLNMWETIYHQQLEGEDPVVTWTMSTMLRPLLDQLSESEGAAFVDDYRQRVRKAYPPRADGVTIMPFKRMFMIAIK